MIIPVGYTDHTAALFLLTTYCILTIKYNMTENILKIGLACQAFGMDYAFHTIKQTLIDHP